MQNDDNCMHQKWTLPDMGVLQTHKWTLAFGACALAVLTLSLMPAPPPALGTGWDKSNHLLAFATLTWLALHAFPQRLRSLLLGLLAYGALIEILQSFTPTRSAEWLDLLADCVGILLGWGAARLWHRMRSRSL